jgi:hypothetical protein
MAWEMPLEPEVGLLYVEIAQPVAASVATVGILSGGVLRDASLHGYLAQHLAMIAESQGDLLAGPPAFVVTTELLPSHPVFVRGSAQAQEIVDLPA